MKNPFAKRIEAFCAFCKTKRKIYRKRRVGFMDLLASALAAVVVMGFIFQEFDPRVFLIFVGFLALSETFIQMRWRMNIVCPHCDFDPVLYAKSPEKAAEKVTRKLDQRRNDPATLLATPLQIPKRRVSPTPDAKAANAPGKRLSKQV